MTAVMNQKHMSMLCIVMILVVNSFSLFYSVNETKIIATVPLEITLHPEYSEQHSYILTGTGITVYNETITNAIRDSEQSRYFAHIFTVLFSSVLGVMIGLRYSQNKTNNTNMNTQTQTGGFYF